MSARIVSLGAVHQSAQELLPWFVMGTLDESDRAIVEQHVSTCAACRSEIEWHEQMRDANVAQPLERDVDRAFAALRARLPAAQRAPQKTNGFALAREWWQSQVAAVRWALALQPIAIVALAALLLFGVGRTASEPQGSFHALSRPEASSAGRLVVVFSPAATQAEMRRVLLSSGTRIVDGPTAADAYVLAVAPDHAEQALRQLRTEHSVLLIQSLEAGSAH